MVRLVPWRGGGADAGAAEVRPQSQGSKRKTSGKRAYRAATTVRPVIRTSRPRSRGLCQSHGRRKPKSSFVLRPPAAPKLPPASRKKKAPAKATDEDEWDEEDAVDVDAPPPKRRAGLRASARTRKAVVDLPSDPEDDPEDDESDSPDEFESDTTAMISISHTSSHTKKSETEREKITMSSKYGSDDEPSVDITGT